MNNITKREPLLNTALGLLPWLIFVIIQNFTSYNNALIIGFISWVLFMIYYSFIKQNQVIQILLKISGGVLLVQVVCPIIRIPELYTTIFCEIILLVVLWFFNHFKQKIKRSYLRRESSYTKKSKSLALSEMFYVIHICRDTLFIHLTIVFIYSLLPEDFHLELLDKFIYKQLGIILMTLVILYEHVRLSIIKRKLAKEDWLPVCNETGRIIGKVAKSISFKSKNQFLHPVVRVALAYKGLLYLTERPSHFISNPNKIDHPFEEYIRFNQDLNSAVNEVILKRSNATDLPFRFIFKYLYKNDQTNRLIYLYIIPIHDEETMNKISLEGGKLWTEKQIEENLDKGVFSEYFEKEYEILKETVLMAQKLIEDPS